MSVTSLPARNGLTTDLAEFRATSPFGWLPEFDEAHDPIFVHDRQFRILRCNAAYAARAGLPMESIVGKPYWEVFPKLPEPHDAGRNELGGEAESEFTTDSGEAFLVHDITSLRASGEFWYGHPLSLWMLDIDHFKDVNDAFGHRAGDIALQALVSTSQKTLRDWDIMGRLGGEEFAVLLPETDTTQAVHVAERLRQAVASTGVPVGEDKTVRLTVSTGIATSRKDDTDLDVLLDRADQALYQAKRTGRDKVCVAA